MLNEIVIDLVKHQNDPNEFLKALSRISKNDNSERLADLLNDCEFDLCNAIIKGVDSGKSIFRYIHIIEHLFPILQHKTDSLLKFCKTCFYSMINDGFQYKQYELIEEFSKKQPEVGKDLLNKLLSIDEEFVVNYIASLFKVQSMFSFKATHKVLIRMSQTTNGHIQQGIISALSTINYDMSLTQDEINLTISLFSSLSKDSSRHNDIISLSLKPFVSRSKEAQDLIVRIASEKDNSVLFNTSRILNSFVLEHFEKEWFKTIIDLYTEISCKQTGTIKNIDYVFSTQIDNNKPDAFKVFLNKWGTKSDFLDHETKIVDLWYSSIYAIEKNGYISNFITFLFNSDEDSSHVMVANIIMSIESQGKENLKLDHEILKTLDFKSIVFICRKILGYLISIDTIYSLLYSVLDCFKTDENVLSFVCKVFEEYLGKDYLSSTIRHLEESIEHLPENNDKLKDYLNFTLDELQNRMSGIKSLPELLEFKSSQKKLNQLYLEDSKNMNEAYEKAEKKSFMSQLGINTVQLKYGNGWFGYYDGEYSEVNKLASISHSFEIPRTEMTGPVNSAILRLSLRLAKRDQL